MDLLEVLLILLMPIAAVAVTFVTLWLVGR